MNKQPLTLLMGFVLLIAPCLIAHGQEKESDVPEGIEILSDNVNAIESEFYKAKQLVLPELARAPKVDEANGAYLSLSQVLDKIIKPESRNKTMDLDFEETSVANIFKTLEEIIGVNIALDPVLLKNQASALQLKQVTIDDVLSILGDSYDLAYKNIGMSLFVTTKQKMHGENVTSRVIKLRYVHAPDIKAMTRHVLETVNTSDNSNSLVVVGTTEEISKVEALVKKLDVPQPQVILEAKIIEINKDALKNLGLDWSDALNTSFQETGRPTSLGTTASSGGSPVKINSFARSPIQFDSIVNMLENDNKARVLSNPRVVTLNNQQAEIFVGDRIPYTITTVAGGVATTEVRFVEPGIRLRITPSIIDHDFVVIKIEPEVSFIFSFRGPQDQYPWVKTRNATAFVRVGNRQSFILGGLIDQSDKKNLYKVPLFGNIPLLGNLFTNKKHTVTDSELIISVTPVIIDQ